MDDSALQGPALPDVSSAEGQHQLNIILSIRRIVLRRWLLDPADDRIIITVSRSGYAVYWSFVRSQILSDRGGFARF